MNNRYLINKINGFYKKCEIIDLGEDTPVKKQEPETIGSSTTHKPTAPTPTPTPTQPEKKEESTSFSLLNGPFRTKWIKDQADKVIAKIPNFENSIRGLYTALSAMTDINEKKLKDGVQSSPVIDIKSISILDTIAFLFKGIKESFSYRNKERLQKDVNATNLKVQTIEEKLIPLKQSILNDISKIKDERKTKAASRVLDFFIQHWAAFREYINNLLYQLSPSVKDNGGQWKYEVQ